MLLAIAYPEWIEFTNIGKFVVSKQA